MIMLSPIWKDAAEDYEFLQLVGVGVFGEVVQARHKKSGNIFAIKLLKNLF